MLLAPERDPLDIVRRQAQHLVSANLYLVGLNWELPAGSPNGVVRWASGQGNGFIIVRMLGDTAQHVNLALVDIFNEAGFELHH